MEARFRNKIYSLFPPLGKHQ